MVRLVSFTKKGEDQLRVGVHLKEEDVIVDIAANGVDFPSMRDLLKAGAEGLKRVEDAVSASRANKTGWLASSDTVTKAPIYNPDKVICIGMNYADHCHEQNFPIPEEPIVFNKFPSSIIADGEDIVKPTETEELDFEVELVIVIGKDGRRISAADAMGHVAGYTVAHDVSARDWQLKKNGGQWLIGKTFDTFAPIGPCIVTTDSLSDPHKLGIRCFLNGETVQDSNTDQLVFKTEKMVEWVSKFFTLKAGDLILTGTPPGVGCFRKPPLFLKDGDVIKCEIDEIGAITNTVRDEKC